MSSKLSIYLGSALETSSPILWVARLQATRLRRVLFLVATASELVQLGRLELRKKSLHSQSFVPDPRRCVASNRGAREDQRTVQMIPGAGRVGRLGWQS